MAWRRPRDVALSVAVDGVAHLHVVGGDPLGDGARRAADAEEPAHHLLARADFREGSVPARIEVNAQSLLMRVGLLGADDGLRLFVPLPAHPARCAVGPGRRSGAAVQHWDCTDFAVSGASHADPPPVLVRSLFPAGWCRYRLCLGWARRTMTIRSEHSAEDPAAFRPYVGCHGHLTRSPCDALPELDRASRGAGRAGTFEIGVPMRDGVELAADVYLPPGAEQEPVPAIVTVTPYGKEGETWSATRPCLPVPRLRVRGRRRARAGQVRGDCSRSSTTPDTHDVIEWAAAQPWCNGKVGTTGLSYMGWVQWAASSSFRRTCARWSPPPPPGAGSRRSRIPRRLPALLRVVGLRDPAADP